MHVGDIQTIVLRKQPNGAWIKVWERDWLLYVGYTEAELDKLSEVPIILKADVSERKKLNFVGFGRPDKKVQDVKDML